MKKTIIYILLFVVIMGFIYYKFFYQSKKSNSEFFAVKIGSVEKTLSVSGKFEPKNYADLSFETPTLISWVGVKVGDQVKKGQVLAKIDKNSLVANVGEAQVFLEKAIEAEKLARRKWDLYKPEEKENFKKTTEEARFRLQSVKAQLSKGTLISPIDGIITKQEARQGEVAQGIVIRVIEEGNFEVNAEVSEADVIELYEGQQAEITFDALGSDRKFSAKITHIDPEAIEAQDVVYYKTTFELQDKADESVRSKMTADIDVLVEKKENVKIIPLRFIKRDDNGSYVFIKNSNLDEKKGFFEKRQEKSLEERKRYIKTGVEGDDGMVEILDGLKENDELELIYEDAKK